MNKPTKGERKLGDIIRRLDDFVNVGSDLLDLSPDAAQDAMDALDLLKRSMRLTQAEPAP